MSDVLTDKEALFDSFSPLRRTLTSNVMLETILCRHQRSCSHVCL